MKNVLMIFCTVFAFIIAPESAWSNTDISAEPLLDNDNSTMLISETQVSNAPAALMLAGDKVKKRKVVSCLCEITLGTGGISVITGSRYACKKNGYEECTSSDQETLCNCGG